MYSLRSKPSYILYSNTIYMHWRRLQWGTGLSRASSCTGGTWYFPHELCLVQCSRDYPLNADMVFSRLVDLLAQI